MGELAALGAAICWVVAPVLFTLSGRNISGATINRLRLLPACILLMCAQLFFEGVPTLALLNPKSMAWLALSGLLGLAFGDTCLLKGYLMIGPRLVTLITTLVPVLSTLLAWLFFGERFSSVETIGASLCLGGICFVVLSRKHGPKLDRHLYIKGLGFAMGGVLGQTLGVITARQGLDGEIPVITAVLTRMLAAALFMWLSQGFRKHLEVMKALDKPALLLILGGATVGPCIGVSLSIFAISATRIGLATTLMATTPILILPLSHFVLKERLGWRDVLGSLVALIGIVLILQ